MGLFSRVNPERTVAFGITAFVTAVAFQGQPRPVALKLADATLSEPFGSIHSIRELADSRVLISDNSTENRLVVVDFRSGRVKAVGQLGSGPGEFQRAGKLTALSGDTTLFLDATRARRWLLVFGDSIVETIPPDWPAMLGTHGETFGADVHGRLLSIRHVGADKLSPNVNRRRLAAVLVSRRGGDKDTLVRLRGDDERVSQVGSRERPFWVVVQLVGSVSEQALLFPDGWIGIVRQDPYRVEWRTPDARLITGPSVPWEAPRSSDREKQAALERLRRRYGPQSDQRDLPWAERLAPFRSGALLGSPDGNLLVLRAQWSQLTDTRYDVFDRSGRRIAQLAMPDSERVVGFGPRSIYVSVTDGDGFQRLRRHAWP
jgi:hypothetical protein